MLMELAGMAGIAGVIGVIPALTAAVAWLVRRGLWPAEVGRKSLHVALGAVAISLPWTVGSSRLVVAGALVAALWFLAVRRVRVLQRYIGPAIHAVARPTAGEFYFVAGVALTYLIARGDPFLYCLPVAILVFADSAAALVGSRIRAGRYSLGTTGKTWPGTATFFAVALLVAWLAVAVFPAGLARLSIPLAFLIAADATLLEFFGSSGTDNALIPLGVIALLLGLERSIFGTVLVHAVALALVAPALLRRPHPWPSAVSGGLYYRERCSGKLREEPVFAGRLLFWSYDNRLGRLVGQFLLRQPLLSRAYGWLNRRGFSRRRIERFARAMRVDVAVCRQPLAAYASFSDFFVREIDLSQRPINPDPRVCTSPADGRVYVLPSVDSKRTFTIKGGRFSLAEFLADDALTARYAGGAMAIVRLHLADYHHFHFPVPGRASAPRQIPGRLHAVGPYARRWPVPFFSENRRALTLIESGRFGLVCMAEIGACTVGSIRQSFQPVRPVLKGERKGYFELGGSTIALLFEPGAIEFDRDLRINSGEDFETYVRMGETIGRAGRSEP
jgi:phosphatidylserine decarboxylase